MRFFPLSFGRNNWLRLFHNFTTILIEDSNGAILSFVVCLGRRIHILMRHLLDMLNPLADVGVYLLIGIAVDDDVSFFSGRLTAKLAQINWAPVGHENHSQGVL